MIKLELLFLVVATQALNLGHKQTQTYYNATNYLSDLEARQAQFKTDINLIKSQIDQINKVLNSSTLTPNQQLRTLSEGTADERDSLYNIETYLNMPFETEPCKPCNLTTQQKQSLQKQVDIVKQSLVNLENQVDFCPECPQIQQIQLEVQKEKNYIKVIEATLNSGCLQRPYEFIPQDPSGLVNLANSLYKDNLKAPNWIYGNITEADYRLYLFSLSTQYNLTSCPLATPYVDSTSKRCYACAGTYSVGQKKCYPCPSDQHYNSTTSKCEQNPKICPNGTTLNTQTNNCEAITCPEGQKYDNATLKCISICSQTEYYNVTTKKCQIIPVTCQPGTRYNSTSGKCQAIVCSAGQVLNSTSNKCQPIVCPIGQTFNLTTKKCEAIVCLAGQIFDFVNARCIDKVNNTLGLCPPDKPFWNSVTIRCEACPNTYPVYNSQLNRCQSCPNGQVWNATLKKCQIGCPLGQTLNPATGKCSPVCPADKPLNPLTNICQTQCPNGTVLNKDTNICEIVCSSGTVLNKTTNKCEIQCPQGQVLNRDTNQCQIVCQTGYKYNSTSKNCQFECPAGLIYNVVSKKCQAQCKANSQWDGNLGGCVCNIGYYSNGTDCLLLVLDRNCSLVTPIWNQTTKKCQTCPIDKPNYSPSLRQCLAPCPTGYIWSNITYNCQMQKCPDAKPILNFTSGQCQPCPPLTEWSQTQKICIKSQINYTCPDGYIFNTTLKKCQIMYCPDGYHLNRNTYQCQKCSEGAYYNSTAQQCYKCPNGTNYDASKGYCQMISCSAGQYASAKLNKCVSIPSCGANQYFSVQNQSCVLIPNCGLNQVFNLSSLKCQLSSSGGGCSSGYFFNTTISQCQPYNYLTSPTSPNLIYTFPFQNYIDQYKLRRESDPASQDCPSATPYYDQKNEYCVSCSKDFPYFNLHTNLCQNCGSEGFDQSLRRCKAQSMNLGPTLQRLIMNIL